MKNSTNKVGAGGIFLLLLSFFTLFLTIYGMYSFTRIAFSIVPKDGEMMKLFAMKFVVIFFWISLVMSVITGSAYQSDPSGVKGMANKCRSFF